MDIIGYLLFFGLLIVLILNKKYNTKQKQESITEEYYTVNKPVKTNYSYEPKYLMTLNEKNQYKKLQKWAYNRNLIVFSKVRLLDLITPRKNQENYKGALWKIQSKHLDFVICDQNIRVKCIVEISDNSHKRQDRADRDNFVLETLQACGYKVLMTYNINDEELDKICGYNQSTI